MTPRFMIRKVDHHVVLDTDFLINLLLDRKEETSFIKRHEGKTFSTTSINIVELYSWAYRSKDRLAAWRDIETLRESLILLNLNDAAVKRSGVIVSEIEKQGKSIDLRDLLIKSIAETNGCQIYKALPPDRR